MTDELKAAEIFRQIDDILTLHGGWPARKLLRDYVELVKKVLREDAHPRGL